MNLLFVHIKFYPFLLYLAVAAVCKESIKEQEKKSKGRDIKQMVISFGNDGGVYCPVHDNFFIGRWVVCQELL